MKIDYKQFGIILIMSLVAVTIISLLISQFFDIGTLKTGPAFILILVAVLLTYMFIAGAGGFDKKEIWTLLFIVGVLIGIIFVLKNYVPEIFSSYIPEPIKKLFEALNLG